MGRALVCEQFLSSAVLAANALLHAGEEAAAKEWLPRIASGQLLATVALQRHSRVRAAAAADGWLLDGVADFVLDGMTAELILIVAETDYGPRLFSLRDEAVTRRPVDIFDTTRRVA